MAPICAQPRAPPAPRASPMRGLRAMAKMLTAYDTSDVERCPARRSRAARARARGRQCVLSAFRGEPELPPRFGDPHRMPVEGHMQLLRRGGGRQGEQGRRVVLPGLQARGEAHRRLRRVLERRHSRIAAKGTKTRDGPRFVLHDGKRGRPGLVYMRSKIAAIPWPPPMHMVTSA